MTQEMIDKLEQMGNDLDVHIDGIQAVDAGIDEVLAQLRDEPDTDDGWVSPWASKQWAIFKSDNGPKVKPFQTKMYHVKVNNNDHYYLTEYGRDWMIGHNAVFQVKPLPDEFPWGKLPDGYKKNDLLYIRIGKDVIVSGELVRKYKEGVILLWHHGKTKWICPPVTETGSWSVTTKNVKQDNPCGD